MYINVWSPETSKGFWNRADDAATPFALAPNGGNDVPASVDICPAAVTRRTTLTPEELALSQNTNPPEPSLARPIRDVSMSQPIVMRGQRTNLVALRALPAWPARHRPYSH